MRLPRYARNDTKMIFAGIIQLSFIKAEVRYPTIKGEGALGEKQKK